ncbi:histone deacetylase [Limnobacter humi]|uniref:Histone deacetylase n=1 Tax=Limnobacter humi TaxID=1778671 RepID=A0ABT1WH73_9BURK|nr:histone deacetylase [Limnobacter humi]MCQ8896092.1 histone deacetylase [Limnobacter humi]
MIEAFYTDEFVLPLPQGHRFPMQKYRMLRDKVSEYKDLIALKKPGPATPGQLALAHSPQYIDRVLNGLLTPAEQKAIGFPWSPAMVERSLRSVGASIEAFRSALQHGAAVNLAGGTHHAKHGEGAGFCVFNDIVVAARVVQTDAIQRMSNRRLNVLVVDLDVHQGDGTAALCRNDPSIFTFSMHGLGNFPFIKEESDIDIALPDGATDDAYLSQLNYGLSQSGRAFQADALVYVAGLDAHVADRLGRLSLTDDGIRERDLLVLAHAQKLGIPVMAVMAGGYFPDLEHLTDLQCDTVLRLAETAKFHANRDVIGTSY